MGRHPGKLTPPLELIGAAEFARLLGTSQQNVSLAGQRALKPAYRGRFPRPDAVFEGRPLWRRDRAEEYARNKNTPPST